MTQIKLKKKKNLPRSVFSLSETDTNKISVVCVARQVLWLQIVYVMTQPKTQVQPSN